MRPYSLIVLGVLCHPILAQVPALRTPRASVSAPDGLVVLPSGQDLSRVQGRVDQPPAQPQRRDWPSLIEDSPDGDHDMNDVVLQVHYARRLPRVPVDLANGELRMRVTDLSVPSRGFSFVWARTYASRSDFDHGHGPNWDFTYNRRVVLHKSGNASLIDGLGRDDLWTGDGTDFSAPKGIFDTLTRNIDSSFTQVNPRGMHFEYDPDGFLVEMSDRAGNTLSIERNAHHNPVRITDTQDRVYTVAYTDGTPGADYSDGTPEQRIASLTDFAGREITYTYDLNGDLTQVRSPLVTGTVTGNDFPSGKTRLYSYSSGSSDERLNHNLLSVVDPLYNIGNDPLLSEARWTFTYAGTLDPSQRSFDRVVAVREGSDQGGPPSDPSIVVGGTWGLSYPPAPTSRSISSILFATRLHGPLRTVVLDPNGNREVSYFDSSRNLVRRREQTNRNVRPGEGDYATRFTYTSEGQLERMVLPRGNEVFCIYDPGNPQRRSQGNLLEVRRDSNGIGGGGIDLVTRYTYDPIYNLRRTVTDPRGFPTGTVPLDGGGHLDLVDPDVARYTSIRLFDYQENAGAQDAAGVPPSEQIPEGLGDLNGALDFDAGNLVKTLLPDIQTAGPNFGDVFDWTFTHNQFAQLLTATDPEGHDTQLSYFPSNLIPGDASDFEGYLQSKVTDQGGFGLTTTYEYDLMGNIVASIDPKGQRTDLFVNDLNQVIRVQSREPFGGTRYDIDLVYDANDNTVRVERENLDETGASFTHGTLVDHYAFDILYLPRESKLDDSENGDAGLSQIVLRHDYDPNLNRTATETPLAVAGTEPGNLRTSLYDERDLPYQRILGDDDLDPANAPPATAVVTTFNYDANKNLLEEIDLVRDAVDPGAPITLFPGSSAGDVTRYVYDGFDRRTVTLDREGNLVSRSFSPASDVLTLEWSGRLDHQVAAPFVTLRRIDFAIDELHRMVTSDQLHFDPDTTLDIGDGHNVTTYEYDLDSKLIRITDDRGNDTQQQWDSAERLTKVIDDLANEAEFAYDLNSNLLQITERENSTDLGSPPDNFVTIYVYDGLDRRIQHIDPAGDIRDFSYDSRSNLVKLSDAVRGTGHPGGPGNITTYTYDGLDRRIQTVRSLTDNGRGDGAPAGSITTTQAWDDNSRLISLTDDNSHTTTYVYDNLDRLIRKDFADTTSATQDWDTDAKTTQMTDQNGTICALSYDGLDRLIARTVTKGSGVVGTTSETFGFDGLSRMTQADNAGQSLGAVTVRFSYDTLDRLTQENQAGKLVDSTYDGVGNRTQCTYPGSLGIGRRTLDLSYDNLNRLQSITETGFAIANMHYKGPYRPEQRTYGPDLTPLTTTTYAYDSMRRLIKVDHNGIGPIAGFEYGYDRGHHRLFEKRTHDLNLGSVYAYDSIYRMTRELEDVDLTATPAGTEILPELFFSLDSEDFAYDGAGSRTTTTDTTGGIPVITTYTQSVGDAEVNQYSSLQEGILPAQNLTYDANGNLTEDGTFTFSYDFKNRLVDVSDGSPVVTYAYDALDRRVQRVTFTPASTTNYYYDGNFCVEERDAVDDVVKQYVWGGLGLAGANRGAPGAAGPGAGGMAGCLLQESTPIDVFYAHEDGRGSVAALVNDFGIVIERYKYGSFGDTIVLLAGTENDFRFKHWRFETTTGLYDCGSLTGGMFYSIALGRFLQPDPGGNWLDPSSLGNRFTLGGNDAVNQQPIMGGMCGTGMVELAGGARRNRGRNTYIDTSSPALTCSGATPYISAFPVIGGVCGTGAVEIARGWNRNRGRNTYIDTSSPPPLMCDPGYGSTPYAGWTYVRGAGGYPLYGGGAHYFADGPYIRMQDIEPPKTQPTGPGSPGGTATDEEMERYKAEFGPWTVPAPSTVIEFDLELDFEFEIAPEPQMPPWHWRHPGSTTPPPDPDAEEFDPDKPFVLDGWEVLPSSAAEEGKWDCVLYVDHYPRKKK